MTPKKITDTDNTKVGERPIVDTLPGKPATDKPEDDGILRVDGNVTQAIYQKYHVKPNRKIKVKGIWSYEYDNDPRVE